MEDLYQYLMTLGYFKTRKKFGEYTLYVNQSALIRIVKNDIYLKSEGQLAGTLLDHNCCQYRRDMPKNRFLLYPYYNITRLFNSQREFCEQLIKEAVDELDVQKESDRPAANGDFKQLPNIDNRHVRLLKNIGIDSVSKLREEGAVRSFMQIRRSVGPRIGVALLWQLAGAVEGKHWSLISQEDREQLLVKCKLTNYEKSMFH
ncbi:hypothetical protein BCU68_01070 [Vibrio sp. 10N.286.49.B3]|nr:hypothetical protein BCU68_01070 [Vibrio sp. 10N.286.49.B3]